MKHTIVPYESYAFESQRNTHIVVRAEARPSEAAQLIQALPDQTFPYSTRNKSYSLQKAINIIVTNEWPYQISNTNTFRRRCRNGL